MKKGLKAKFTQNNYLREFLISTENKILVEHSINDKFWADGGDGSGKNMLG